MTLDEAWAAAEAALPDGWAVVQVRRHFKDPNENWWTAEAASRLLKETGGGGFDYTASVQESGLSPAAALHNLAAALRGAGVSGG